MPPAIRTAYVLKRVAVLDVVVEEPPFRACLAEGVVDAPRHFIVAIEFTRFPEPDAECAGLVLIGDAADRGRRHGVSSHGPFPRNAGTTIGRRGRLALFGRLLLALVGRGREFAQVFEDRGLLDRLAPRNALFFYFFPTFSFSF